MAPVLPVLAAGKGGEGGCLSVLKKDGLGLGVLKKKTYSHWYFA